MMKSLAIAHRRQQAANQPNYKVFSKRMPTASRQMQISSSMTLFILINTLRTSYSEEPAQIRHAYVFLCVSSGIHCDVGWERS